LCFDVLTRAKDCIRFVPPKSHKLRCINAHASLLCPVRVDEIQGFFPGLDGRRFISPARNFLRVVFAPFADDSPNESFSAPIDTARAVVNGRGRRMRHGGFRSFHPHFRRRNSGSRPLQCTSGCVFSLSADPPSKQLYKQTMISSAEIRQAVFKCVSRNVLSLFWHS